MGLYFFNYKISKNHMNKYFETKQSLRKPVVSMTLSSIAFNGKTLNTLS